MKTHSTQLQFAVPSLWAAAVTLIRSSVILLYIRIFPMRRFRLICYTVLVFNTAFFIAAVLSYCLFCVPIRCQWDVAVQCTSCGNTILYSLLNAVLNLLLDINVVLLPMPILWGLQISLGRKATLCGMFGLGFT